MVCRAILKPVLAVTHSLVQVIIVTDFQGELLAVGRLRCPSKVPEGESVVVRQMFPEQLFGDTRANFPEYLQLSRTG